MLWHAQSNENGLRHKAESNQAKTTWIVLNSFTNGLKKFTLFFLIDISLCLVDLQFVWKQLQVIVNDSMHSYSWNINFLRQWSCRLPWWFFKKLPYFINISICYNRIMEKFEESHNIISYQIDETLKERQMKYPKISKALDWILYLIGKQRISYWGTHGTENFSAVFRQITHCYIYIRSEFIHWALWRTLMRTEYFLFLHHTTSILAKLSTWCFEHSGNISCFLLVNPSHTDESWEGRNTCLRIYIYIYIYIHIYLYIDLPYYASCNN